MGTEKQLNAQKEKIRKLEAEIEQSKSARHAIESELAQCWGNLNAIRDADGKKKWGVFWLAVAIVLIVIEICLLTEIIPGYGKFQLIDLIIIAIPLCLGIKRIKSVRAARKLGSADKLEAQIQELQAKIIVYDKLDADLAAAKKELERITRYSGREWNLATFVATPENVREMEQDAEAVFITLQYSRGSHFMVNNWIAKNRLELANARLGNNSTLSKHIDEGLQNMGTSGSWKLQIVQLVMLSLDIVIMNALFSGAMGKEMDLLDMLEKSSVRQPETEDECTFYELAHTGSVIMNSTVKHELKKTIRPV